MIVSRYLVVMVNQNISTRWGVLLPMLVLLLIIKSVNVSALFLAGSRTARQALEANNASIANTVIEVFNNCRCVEYYLCDNDNFIITDGRTIIEERGRQPQNRHICEGGSYRGEIVCCKNRSELTTTIKDLSPNITNIDKNLNNGGNAHSNINGHNNETTNKPIKKKKKLLCGTQLPTINVRIFAGEDELTPINGEFPWLAAIFKKVDGNLEFHCSGSLIHPKVVMTANHCIKRYRAEDLAVSINGNIELPNTSKDPVTSKSVSEIIKHPEFHAAALYNDIGLLILEETFEINKNIHTVNTICLPSKRKNVNNLRCLVAGWGKTKSDDEGTRVLKKVELPMVKHSRCQNLLRSTRLGPVFELHESFTCAGGEEGKDACTGDGGSPLMCPLDSGRYFQAGIVSWGIGCGTKDVPGVYAKVSHFHDWIMNELEKRQISIDS